MLHSSFTPRLAAIAVLVGLTASHAVAETPAWLAGYADDAEYNRQIEALGKLDLVQTKSLGESVGGRKLWLVAVGKGEIDKKPAIAVVGPTDGKLLLGTELSLRMIRSLAKQGSKDDATGKLLERYTFYFLPRPDPDTAQKCFASPLKTPAGNDRRTDDDRDFEVGEDPADELNGDGFITQMRIEDETGEYIPHPNDSRLLVKADPKKNERGKYRLLVEGRDSDGDEEYNEDGGDGVSIDRNFPYQYKPFEPHHGEHAASEPETRALLDFFYDHPNIAIVFSFSEDNNLLHPWKPNSDKQKIRQAIFPDDASLLERIATDYKSVHGGSDPPSAVRESGAFSTWAYFHFGRWSLSSRGWWPPKVAADAAEQVKDAEGEEASAKTDDKQSPDQSQDDKAEDKRAADERNLLRWLAANKIDGFVPWQAVEHPDFPGNASVGGFKPLAGFNPLADELDGLADKHLKFVLSLPDYLPTIAVVDAKAESLGSGIHRVSGKVLNRGYLPTVSEMGSTNEQPYPLQFAIELPKGALLIQGSARERLKRLESGKHLEKIWIVRFPDETPEQIRLRAWAPAVGESSADIPLNR
jgi:hypothetical protein